MRFRARHDFNKSQPQWTGNYPRHYGPRNEGFTIEADSIEQAKHQLRTAYNLNPFYVKLEEVKQ